MDKCRTVSSQIREDQESWQLKRYGVVCIELLGGRLRETPCVKTERQRQCLLTYLNFIVWMWRWSLISWTWCQKRTPGRYDHLQVERIGKSIEVAGQSNKDKAVAKNIVWKSVILIPILDFHVTVKLPPIWLTQWEVALPGQSTPCPPKQAHQRNHPSNPIAKSSLQTLLISILHQNQLPMS